MKLKTRVFELSNCSNLSELAEAMGISASQVCRVRQGKRGINEKFIIGAAKAFPGYKFDDLFYVAPNNYVAKMPKQQRVILTTSGAAQLLGVHPNTIRQWSKKGILKSYRISARGDRRFKQEDVDSFLKEAESRRVE